MVVGFIARLGNTSLEVDLWPTQVGKLLNLPKMKIIQAIPAVVIHDQKEVWIMKVRYNYHIRSGVKLKKIVGGVYSPNLPTNRFRSTRNCRKIRLLLSFVSNSRLTSMINIRQMRLQAKYGRGVRYTRTPFGYTSALARSKNF